MTMTVLVTGSTEGLGLAAAQQLVRAGHTVLIHGRSQAKVASVVTSLTGGGSAGRAKGYVADLSLMSEVRQLGAQVAAEWPRLDGLLNNAGSFDGDYTGRRLVTGEGNEYTLAVNVLAPFLLTALLLPSLKASGAGRVVISSSVSMGEASSLGDLQLEGQYSGHRACAFASDRTQSLVPPRLPTCPAASAAHVAGTSSRGADSLSKLCDAMLSQELHARYGDPPRLTFNTMDPTMQVGMGGATLPNAPSNLPSRLANPDSPPPIHPPIHKAAMSRTCPQRIRRCCAAAGVIGAASAVTLPSLQT